MRVAILGCLSIFSFSCLFSGCVSTSARWSTPTSAMVLRSPPLPSPSHSKHLEACNQTRSWGSLPRNWRLSKRPPSAAILLFSRFPSRSSSRRAVRAELSTSVEAACYVGPVLPRLFSHSPRKLIGKCTTRVSVHRTGPKWTFLWCSGTWFLWLLQLLASVEFHKRATCVSLPAVPKIPAFLHLCCTCPALWKHWAEYVCAHTTVNMPSKSHASWEWKIYCLHANSSIVFAP